MKTVLDAEFVLEVGRGEGGQAAPVLHCPPDFSAASSFECSPCLSSLYNTQARIQEWGGALT